MSLRALKHYGWQMWRGCVQGAAKSLKGLMGIGGAHMLLPNQVPTLDVRDAVVLFGIFMFWDAVDYLGDNPLPEDEEIQTHTAEVKT